MFGQNFQRKYALTDQGVRNTKKGTFWTFLVNLIVMGGMGILYLLMYKLMDTLTEGQPLPSAPPLLGLVVLFVLLSFLTHLQQYKATYGLVYNEVKATRLSLAERLRKLPLGYFGKRDLADLTETLMGDVNRMEHVWSHVLGYLYGSYLSTALIAVCLLVYDWQLAIACLWGVPVAFGLLFGTRRLSARSSERTKKAAVRVSDGIQEALENVRVFRQVGFAYDKKKVLDGVSFTAKEGEVTALVGPSGSGKSTCARLAARLWDVTEGTIQVGGVDISTVDPEALLRDYSMVFQDVVLFDDTVMENIRLGRRGATDEEVRAAAEAANCGEFIRRLPQGYDTPIGENGAKLSGGERQRISIARALLKDAPIVLLDEATASLDVENETKVQGALSRLLAGKTVLVIAHRMRTVAGADHIVVLENGHVAEQGTPAELMARSGLYRRMVELQSQSAQWQLNQA